MKLNFLLALFCLSLPTFAAPVLTEADFMDGFIVARLSGGMVHTVEAKFKKMNGVLGMVVVLKEGALDSSLKRTCEGNAYLRNNLLTVDVMCGREELILK